MQKICYDEDKFNHNQGISAIKNFITSVKQRFQFSQKNFTKWIWRNGSGVEETFCWSGSHNQKFWSSNYNKSAVFHGKISWIEVEVDSLEYFKDRFFSFFWNINREQYQYQFVLPIITVEIDNYLTNSTTNGISPITCIK